MLKHGWLHGFNMFEKIKKSPKNNFLQMENNNLKLKKGRAISALPKNVGSIF